MRQATLLTKKGIKIIKLNVEGNNTIAMQLKTEERLMPTAAASTRKAKR